MIATALTVKKLAAMGFACTMVSGTVGVVASSPIKRAVHRIASPARHHVRPAPARTPTPAAVPYCIPAPGAMIDAPTFAPYTLPDVPGGTVQRYDGGGFAPGVVIGSGPDAPPPVIDAPTSPVPAPSTWMLSIVGFGLIARTLRRRRRDPLASYYRNAGDSGWNE